MGGAWLEQATSCGRALFEALAEQESVARLLRGVGALDDSELAVIVLERAPAEMVERRRPSR